MAKKKSPFQERRHEIIYHVINSLLAGALVLAGAFANGSVTRTAILTAVGAGAIVAFTKFRDYWTGQEKSYSTKVFSFMPSI